MIIKKETDIPLYGGVLAVLITDEKTYVENHFDNLGESNFIDYAHTIQVNTLEKKPKRCILVAFNLKNRYAKVTNGVITHESFHAADMILNHHGLELSTSSCEAYAYLMQWITNNIYELFVENDIEISLKAE